MATLRSASSPTSPLLPLTAGSMLSVWVTWPDPHPATPSATRPTAIAGRILRSGPIDRRLTIAVLPRAGQLMPKGSGADRGLLRVVCLTAQPTSRLRVHCGGAASSIEFLFGPVKHAPSGFVKPRRTRHVATDLRLLIVGPLHAHLD